MDARDAATSSRPRGASSTPIPTVRVIVNTGDGHGVPDRRRRRAAEPRPRRRCASSRGAPSDVELQLHGVAQRGVEAGDRRGERHVRGRWAALRRRRRHRDRRRPTRTFLDPHVSVGQVSAYEAIGLVRKIADGAGHAHGVRRSRTSGMSAHAGVPARHRQRGRRPARAAARRSAGAGREDRRTRPPRWPRPSGRCGARSSSASPTPAVRRAELVSMWGHPDQAEGPPPSPRSASRWQPLDVRSTT